MNSMKERFDILKKEHGITYQRLSESLGVTYDAVRMSIGRGKLSALQYQEIERTFSVSQEWIKTGLGDIFIPQPDRNPSSSLDTNEETEKELKILELAEQTGNIKPHEARIVKYELLTLKSLALRGEQFENEFWNLKDELDKALTELRKMKGQIKSQD